MKNLIYDQLNPTIFFITDYYKMSETNIFKIISKNTIINQELKISSCEVVPPVSLKLNHKFLKALHNVTRLSIIFLIFYRISIDFV